MNWLDQLLGPHHVGMLLWAGVGVLTAALLIVSRTRWGQARPLSKCVGLSVYAHFLFGGYAYMTDFFEAPLPVEPPPMTITYIEYEAQLEAPSPVPEDEQQPWERLSTAAAEAPPVAPQERVPTDLPLPTPQQQAEAEPPLPDGSRHSILDIPPPDVVPPDPAPNLPAAEPLKVDRPQLAAAEIEAQSVAPHQPRERADLLRPGVMDMARMETTVPLPSESTKQAPAEQPDSADDSAALQRLAQVPLQAAAAEAIFDRLDRLHQSSNNDLQAMRDSPPPAGSPRAPLPGGGPLDSPLLAAGRPLPRRLGDGAVMPAPYRNRVEPLKSEALRQHGGDQRTEAAVNAALRWLAANQSPDGRWSSALHGGGRESMTLGHDRQGAGSRADTAMTGLAILAFVGAGHSHLEGDYRETVRKGIDFLVSQQKPGGDLAGDSLLYARMYCHGIAFLSLSETYALSGDHRLRSVVESAVQFTVDAQHPATGGWRYQPGDRGDMSQFGWQVMALRSAEHAGLSIPGPTRTRMESFFRSVSGGQHGGLARYRKGERLSRTMTAEALACRHFLSFDDNPAAAAEASAYILQELPSAAEKPNLYYWYYATLGLFPQQDESWRTWNAALIEQLVSRQRLDGPQAGSWDTDTVWGSYGGRVYTTALSAMCLEVYYRYQPLLQAEDNLRGIRSAGRPLPWR